MMKLIIIIILVAIGFQGNASDWDLLQPHKETFYCIDRDGADFTSRYEVDSVRMNADGSQTYLINFKYREDLFTACTDWNNSLYYEDLGVWDYFSVDSINIHSDLHHIIYGSDTLIIPTKADVGFTASTLSYDVECVSVDYASFLGTTDSIKFFSISDDSFQGELVISKNHGILEGPYFFDLLNGMPEVSGLKLAGTEIAGTFSGKRSDDFIEYLPFEIGDSLYVKLSTSGPLNTTYYVSTNITNVLTSSELLTITFERDQMAIISDPYGSDTTYSNYTQSMDYNLEKLQYALDYGIHYYLLQDIPSLYTELVPNNNRVLRIDADYDSINNKNTIGFYRFGSEVNLANCEYAVMSDSQERITWTRCHGETYRGYFEWASMWTGFDILYAQDSGLACSDDSIDCENADWEITSNTSISSSLESELIIYPNPAKDYISVKAKGLEIEKVSVINMGGKELIYSGDTQNSIDVSLLPSGLFYLRIEHSKGISIEKFTKI